MEEKVITAYVTRYALSVGILEVEARFRIGSDLIVTNEKYPQYLHKGDWFLTKKEAIIDAEKRREKKLKSLENQIQKLKKLKYN